MRQRLTAATIAICLSAVFSGRAQTPAGSGWTQLRGPNATGVASGGKASPIDFGPGKNML